MTSFVHTAAMLETPGSCQRTEDVSGKLARRPAAHDLPGDHSRPATGRDEDLCLGGT